MAAKMNQVQNDEDEYSLFIEAISEFRDPRDDKDVATLRAECQVYFLSYSFSIDTYSDTLFQAYKNRLQKLTRDLKRSQATSRKQATIIDELNKERVKSKTQLIETSYAKKTAEYSLVSQSTEVTSLKNELKSKGEMLLALEKDRRRLEHELNRFKLNFDRRSETPIAYIRPRTRSVSADRLSSARSRYSKQLLIKSGSPLAYHATKSDDEDDGQSKQDLEKVVLLQKLLLQKSKQLVERDVKVDDLEKLCNEQSQMISRLKRAKQYAEELTEARHKLNLRTNQLNALKEECTKNKTEITALRAELVRLREKLSEFYSEKAYFG